MPPVGLFLWVALGGALGAVARYGVETALPVSTPAWPWATFAINLVGAFAIGVVVAEINRHHKQGKLVCSWFRPLVVTGMLGGFTTFSTFMVEVVERLSYGDLAAFWWGVAYLSASLVAGFFLALLGLRLGTGGRLRLPVESLAEMDEA